MADIIAIGGATRDITFLTDKGRVIETPENLTEQRLLGFEYGAKIRSEDVHMNFGSGASNAAVTFAKMGLETAICARVGNDDNGVSIIENFKRHNIDIGLIQKDEKENSGFAFVVINKDSQGERVIFVHKGASNNLEIRESDIEKAEWIYLTTLSGPEWGSKLDKIAQIVRDNGIKLAWNPGELEIEAGRERLGEVLASTEILIINKDEAIELVQKDGNSGIFSEELNDTVKLIAVIKSWGPKAVVITDGKNGALLSCEGGVMKAPALIKEQVDTTGAGDAFGSGLVAGYILTGSWETALQFGIINSSGTVTEYGAQNGIMSREEAEKDLAAVPVEKIS